ncbi:multidrug efflux ABC transporter permease LieB [Luteimicrobium xylanilyticum]|uniref:Transport permease protein n=1 Tax=Luteimicrobium xylanilyticum TaxID=1133546 RepID=A0A5P9QF69_9MICO|nr:ABC transporter permease [Luteimicrobium xylanilyticum]QFU99909.1 Daunorubicin/doxorubicin resistance ABC transporter permease protein DrrB [Luteimicrobium xylanilyticum]
MTTLAPSAPTGRRPAVPAVTATPAAPSALTGIRDIGTMTAREIRRTLRSVDGLITAFAIPVSIMLVFVVIFGGALDSSGDYINYVVPGTLVLCLGFGSAATATAVAQDMTSGTIDRFKTLPILGPAPLWGHVIASVVRNLASAAVVLGVAVALGFRPDADVLGWVAVVGYVILTVLAFTWICAAAGLVLSVDATQALNTVFLFLPYLSSGFVAVGTMPTWLHGFADNQPFTPIIESLRGLMAGSVDTSTLWTAVAWLVGFLAVSIALGSLAYRRRTAR